MTLTEARTEAKKYGAKFGKFTSDKSSFGEYTLYEDGKVVAEGFAETASEMKVSYILHTISERI